MIPPHLCGLHQFDISLLTNQEGNGFGKLQAYFQREPESDVRKFTNFSFELKFLSETKKIIQLLAEDIRCMGPVTYGTELEKNNGIGYKIKFKELNGATENHHVWESNIFVWMVDSQTEEVVVFENEESDVLKRRVLLTHEMTCQRCIKQNCGCGNKNERSGCPVAVGTSTLQFFMKCNQNCQSKAGNTRNRRRFKIMVTEGDGSNFFSRILCLSQEMFVHNNSKFGANRIEISSTKRTRKIKQDTEPKIRALIPSGGSYNQLVVINGVNFVEGLQVFFGKTPAETRVITDTAISAIVPQLGSSGYFRICLNGNGKSWAFETPFRYVSSSTTSSYDPISPSLQISRPMSPFRSFTITANAPILPFSSSSNSAVTCDESTINYSNSFQNQNTQICFTNTPPQSPTGVAYGFMHSYSSHRNEMLMMEQRTYDSDNLYDDCMLPGKRRRT